MLAAILAVVTIPAHLVGLRGPWPDPDPAEHAPERRRPGAGRRSRAADAFLLLTAAVALGAFTAFAVVVNQVPLLLERGLSTSLRRGRSDSAASARYSAASATAGSPHD